MVIFASFFHLVKQILRTTPRITVNTVDDNKLNLGLLVQRSATRTYTWITLLRLVVWQSSHREIKKLRRKRKRKEGICQAKNDGMPYTSRFSNQLYRELLAVDNFFDNFPKKTPIARALIYSIKVGGFPNPILKPEF